MSGKKTLATWIPSDLVDKVDQRIQQGSFVSYSDYLRALIREDLKRNGLGDEL